MPDQFNSPSLSISNIVHGRRNDTGRVEYMLDPTGQDNSRFEIPEEWKIDGVSISPDFWVNASCINKSKEDGGSETNPCNQLIPHPSK